MGAGRQHSSIEDRYQVEHRVGQGQTAAVYAAVDQDSGMRVALKVLHKHHARSKGMRARFVREALAVQRLSSEHAVRVFDVGEDIDHRVDVYALGVLLYEMLAGVSPFASATTFSTLLNMVSSGAPSLSRHRNDLPPRLMDIVARAMEPDPAWRIASMTSLRSLLAPHWSQAHPLPIPTESPPEPDVDNADTICQTQPVSAFAATHLADSARITDSTTEAPAIRSRLPSFSDELDDESYPMPPPPSWGKR